MPERFRFTIGAEDVPTLLIALPVLTQDDSRLNDPGQAARARALRADIATQRDAIVAAELPWCDDPSASQNGASDAAPMPSCATISRGHVVRLDALTLGRTDAGGWGGYVLREDIACGLAWDEELAPAGRGDAGAAA